MPFDLAPIHGVALAAGLFLAAFVRGYSGFGFSAIFIAIAALFTNPVPLIPVVFICEIAMTGFQAKGIFRHVDWRRSAALLVGAAIALPFSITVMIAVGADTARLIISGLVGALALLLLSGRSLRRPLTTGGNVAVGLAAGIANGAGVGGLPVAAAMSAQHIAAPVFRATMIVFLTGLDLLSLPWLWRGGLITNDTGLALALAFPILGLGVWLGSRRFGATSPATFRRFAVLLLLALSALGLLRALLIG